ncbi:MAG: hypothetical protein ACE5KM_00675 [Planctomycetaceae bacterium]
MALQHRAAGCSLMAFRLVAVLTCFGCAMPAATAYAQSYGNGGIGTAPGRPSAGPARPSLTDRLRLFNRRRRGRSIGRRSRRYSPSNRLSNHTPANGPMSSFEMSRLESARSAFGPATISEWGARVPSTPSGPSAGSIPPTLGGHTMPPADGLRRSVYNPTSGPDEIVPPPGALTHTAAQIPEVVPRDDEPDPNLLPPLPDRPEVSTWQRYREQLLQERSVVLQRTFSRGTWLFGGTDKVGMFDIYTQGTFQFRSLPGFAFTPYFQAYFLDGPRRTDLPARLYLVAGEFRQFVPVGRDLVLDLWVAPGVFSDFEAGNSDAFRVQAKAVGIYQWSPTSRFLLGILYLDRDDVNVLPVVGWIYVPNAELRMELVFPRPKIAMRFSQRETYSRWGYIAGEFGGDSWAIQRRSGATDTLVYRDLRLIFGFEQRYVNGRSFLLEVGYVFDRQVEYGSGVGDFDPGSTGMLRAGLTY